MSYIDRNLLADEEVVYRTGKHYIIFLVPAFLTVLTLFTMYYFENTNPFIAKLAFLPGIAAIITWLSTLLTYLTIEYVVTNKRLLMKEGFFIVQLNEVRLPSISNTTLDQSIIGSLLNYGSIFIHIIGGDIDPLTLVGNPNTFLRAIRGQMDVMAK